MEGEQSSSPSHNLRPPSHRLLCAVRVALWITGRSSRHRDLKLQTLLLLSLKTRRQPARSLYRPDRRRCGRGKYIKKPPALVADFVAALASGVDRILYSDSFVLGA